MPDRYDVIVLGLGGVGSAALYHVARRGNRVLGIDQFSPPHDLGSSHGQTRIIRQAYFEHPDYVPLVLRSYELWREVEAASGQSLFSQVGLLEVGPTDGVVVPGVLASAAQHHLDVEELSAADVVRRFPGFRAPPNCVGVFEAAAGFLRVEQCVAAHLQLAGRAGATLQTDTTVVDWSRDGSGFVVTTDRGIFRAERLVITAGPWAARVLPALGVSLEVRRKPIYWFDTAAGESTFRADAGCPTFLYELPDGVFYGFPQFDDRGVKVAQHSGGGALADPSTVDRSLDEADRAAVANFTASWLAGLATRHREHATCLYTMSPDEHFIVDTLPGEPHVAFAAGLSGHGYKFAPVLGEILADLAECGQTNHPVAFLRLGRFATRTP
ncbi:MAG: N-methyl-L-tryptophan oxidase [Pirellulales bacterium]